MRLRGQKKIQKLDEFLCGVRMLVYVTPYEPSILWMNLLHWIQNRWREHEPMMYNICQNNHSELLWSDLDQLSGFSFRAWYGFYYFGLNSLTYWQLCFPKHPTLTLGMYYSEYQSHAIGLVRIRPALTITS